jgi:hypothetical protein
MLVFLLSVFTDKHVLVSIFHSYLYLVIQEDYLRVNTVDSTHKKSSTSTMVYVAGIVHLAMRILTILYRTDLLLIQCLNEKLRT